MTYRFETLPLLIFHLILSNILGYIPYITIRTSGLGNHYFQMGFYIATPSVKHSFSINIFILIILRNFKIIRMLDKCPVKVGFCIGTPFAVQLCVLSICVMSSYVMSSCAISICMISIYMMPSSVWDNYPERNLHVAGAKPTYQNIHQTLITNLKFLTRASPKNITNEV